MSDDAPRPGIVVLGLDVNASQQGAVVEPIPGGPDLPWGARVALGAVKGIDSAEVERVLAGRPFSSLTDFWQRAHVSRVVVERLVLAGGFDSIYSIDASLDAVRPRGRVTRRDLLLQVAALDRYARALDREPAARGSVARAFATDAATRNSSDRRVRGAASELERHPLERAGVWARAAARSTTTPPPPVTSVQLALDLGDEPVEGHLSGLPEMSIEERIQAELEILGLVVTRHLPDTRGRRRSCPA